MCRAAFHTLKSWRSRMQLLGHVGLERVERDVLDELRVGVLLGVLVVEPVLVLHEDHPAHPQHLGQDEEAEVRTVRGKGTVLRGRLPEVVRRNGDDDGEHPVLDVERQLPEVLALHDDGPVLGQERIEEDGVGLLHGAHQLRDAPGRDAQIERDGDRVADAGAAADADHHLVLAAQSRQLGHQGEQGLLAAIEDGLPADPDEDHVGHDLELGLGVGAGDHFAIDQRLTHETGLDVRPPVVGHELAHLPSLPRGSFDTTTGDSGSRPHRPLPSGREPWRARSAS